MPDDELMSKILLESRQIAQLNQKLADQLQSSQATANSLKADVARLQSKYADHSSDSRLKFLEQAIEEKVIQIGRLQKQVAQYEQARESKDNHIALLQGEIAELKRKISNKNELIGELGRNLQTQDLEFDKERKANMAVSDEVKELKANLTDSEERLKKFHSMVSLLEDKLKEMGEKSASYEKERDEIFSELQRARESNDNLMMGLKKSKNNTKLLIDDLRIKDKIIQDTRRKQMERQKGITKLSSQLREMQEKLKIIDGVNTEALQKLQSAQTKENTLKEELAHQKELNSKMQILHETALRMKEAKHATRIKELISDHTHIQLKLKTELEFLKEKVQTHKEPLKPLRLEEEVKGFMQATPEELIPMVKTALDHGDSEEKITSTLITSGYEQKVIKKAMEKIIKN